MGSCGNATAQAERNKLDRKVAGTVEGATARWIGTRSHRREIHILIDVVDAKSIDKVLLELVD